MSLLVRYIIFAYFSQIVSKNTDDWMKLILIVNCSGKYRSVSESRLLHVCC